MEKETVLKISSLLSCLQLVQSQVRSRHFEWFCKEWMVFLRVAPPRGLKDVLIFLTSACFTDTLPKGWVLKGSEFPNDPTQGHLCALWLSVCVCTCKDVWHCRSYFQTFWQHGQFVFIAFTAAMFIKAAKYCFVRFSSLQSYIHKC